MQKYYLIGSSYNKIIEDENKYLMDNEIFNIYLSNRIKKIALYNTKKDLLTGKISFSCSNKESKNISRDIIIRDVFIGDTTKFVSDIKDNEQYYIRKVDAICIYHKDDCDKCKAIEKVKKVCEIYLFNNPDLELVSIEDNDLGINNENQDINYNTV
jgi:hypothetical protein